MQWHHAVPNVAPAPKTIRGIALRGLQVYVRQRRYYVHVKELLESVSVRRERLRPPPPLPSLWSTCPPRSLAGARVWLRDALRRCFAAASARVPDTSCVYFPQRLILAFVVNMALTLLFMCGLVILAFWANTFVMLARDTEVRALTQVRMSCCTPPVPCACMPAGGLAHVHGAGVRSGARATAFWRIHFRAPRGLRSAYWVSCLLSWKIIMWSGR